MNQYSAVNITRYFNRLRRTTRGGVDFGSPRKIKDELADIDRWENETWAYWRQRRSEQESNRRK